MSNIYIPNYEILKVLGEGGMALVYLAEHRLLHNRVALKVLNREFVHNENIRKRFLSEARSMAKMSHPNIVRVTDMVEDDQTVAFVMEYIEGESLKEYMDRKGKLGDEQILYILLQMLDALEYAHQQGLVHRDIKPSNFMLTSQRKLMLMDFGIAKQLNPGSQEYTSTGTNQQMGTAMYMSPEQIHETRSVTSQSDIYSLGVVLWQLVTGQKPYSTETLSAFQLQTKIVNEPLPLTGTNWDSYIQKATEKDAQNRYADINAFRSAWQKGQNDLNERRDIGDKTVIEDQIKDPSCMTPRGHAKQHSAVSFLGSVRVGKQEWQAENLNVDRFRNGDLIPEVRTKEEWEAALMRGEPAWCYNDNDPENGKIYGKLYNWYAVNDSLGLAPEGWHIPTDGEWTILTDYLGGEEVAGGKMKTTGMAYWESPNEGATNESGFSALPGGYRDSRGSFYGFRCNAFFWSATVCDFHRAWNRNLYINGMFRDGYYIGCGLSVRCLRD